MIFQIYLISSSYSTFPFHTVDGSMYNDCGEVIGKRLSDAQKIYIIDHHIKPSPDYNFPKTFMAGCSRRFKWIWLEQQNWFRYSSHVDGGFCLSCVLFSKSSKSHTFVKQPFREFAKCGASFDRHIKYSDHLEAVERCKNFIRTTRDPSLTIDQLLSKTANATYGNNLHILSHCVKTGVFWEAGTGH